jgi:hypothetical protein
MLGCSRGPSEEELKLAELQQSLEDIRQVSTTLQQTRADVEAKKASVAELEAIPERKRSDEQTQQLTDLNAEIEQATATATELYEDLQTRLQVFLTTALNDFPQAPVTADGLAIYSEEAILNAGDTVQASGDYKKAIETLETAKGYYEAIGLEPHQPLLDQLVELNDWRNISQERFDAVTKGMTEDEVKAAAGVPYYRNVKEDEARGVTFWLYPKPDGGAAAIYFNKKGKVYEKKWDAVRTRVAE